MSALGAEIAAEVEGTHIGGGTAEAHVAAHPLIVSEIHLRVKGPMANSGIGVPYPRLL